MRRYLAPGPLDRAPENHQSTEPPCWPIFRSPPKWPNTIPRTSKWIIRQRRVSPNISGAAAVSQLQTAIEVDRNTHLPRSAPYARENLFIKHDAGATCANRREEDVAYPRPAPQRCSARRPALASLSTLRARIVLAIRRRAEKSRQQGTFGGLMITRGARIERPAQQIPTHFNFRTAGRILREERFDPGKNRRSPSSADADNSSARACAQESFLAHPRRQRLLLCRTSNANH